MATFDQKTTRQCIVETVVPLSEKQLTSIRTHLNLDESVELVNQKTNSLLGGMRIRYQGQLIDLSFKHMLDQIKEDNE